MMESSTIFDPAMWSSSIAGRHIATVPAKNCGLFAGATSTAHRYQLSTQNTVLVDILIIFLVVLTTKWIKLEGISYIGWIIMALKTAFISVPIVMLVNWIFYKEQMKKILRKVRKKEK